MPMIRGDEATEHGLSVLSAAPDSGVTTNFAISANAARLDVQPDEVGISYGYIPPSNLNVHLSQHSDLIQFLCL